MWTEKDSRKSLETYQWSLTQPHTETEKIQTEAVISFIKYMLGMTDGVVFMTYDSSEQSKIGENDE